MKETFVKKLRGFQQFRNICNINECLICTHIIVKNHSKIPLSILQEICKNQQDLQNHWLQK